MPDKYSPEPKPALHTTGSAGTSSGQSEANMLANAPFGMDDSQNRTRNAVAQRRHREKRKAHLKNLEESVQTLTSELESARRQLGGGAGFAGPSRLPMGGSRSLPDFQAENAFLREQNEELRRQLHAYRETYPHLPPPLPLPSLNPEKGDWDQRGQFGVTYGQSGISPVKTERDDGSSNSAPGTAGYQSADPFGNVMDNRQPRSRVLSASSAPPNQANQSPYISAQSAFPTDPRAHSLASSATPLTQSTGNNDSRYQVRYDQPHMFSGAHPPHQAARYDMSHQSYSNSTAQSNRQDGDLSWTNDHVGPPPFNASVPYNVGFQHDQQQHQQHQHHSDWRHGGHE